MIPASGKGRAGVPIHPAAQSPNLGLISDYSLCLSPTSTPLKSVGFIFKTHTQSEHVSPPSPQPSLSKPLSSLAWPMITASQMAPLLQHLPHTAAKQSLKSINQNLSPTWLKTLNGFPVHLKSKHCTMYMYIMCSDPFHRPHFLPFSPRLSTVQSLWSCFCSLNLFSLFLARDLCASSSP